MFALSVIIAVLLPCIILKCPGSWNGKPVDRAKDVRRPYAEHHQKHQARPIYRPSPPKPCAAAHQQHAYIESPHSKGKDHFGIAKIGRPHALLRQQRANQQPNSHAMKADHQRTMTDLVHRLKGGSQARNDGLFRSFSRFSCMQIEQAGQQAEDQRSIGGQQRANVDDDPAVARPGRTNVYLSGPIAGNTTSRNASGRAKSPKESARNRIQIRRKAPTISSASSDCISRVPTGIQRCASPSISASDTKWKTKPRDRGHDKNSAPTAQVVEHRRQSAKRRHPVTDRRDPEPE